MNNFDEIVKENMGLVFSVAGKFLNRGVEFDDLVQIGSIGLIKAAEKFDSSLGYKFSTYAVNLIIGEIKRFLRDDGMVKISRKLKENLTKVRYSSENLKQKLGREPTLSELSDNTNLSVEDVVNAMESEYRQQSIYDKDEKDDTYKLDKIKCNDDTSNEQKIYVKELIDKLDERSKIVVTLRYFYDLTQSQVGDILNLSQVQISRIEKAAIIKMKGYA